MYKKNIMVLPFIREMDLAFGAADVIISRAGAGTISELALVGKPVILVPSSECSGGPPDKKCTGTCEEKCCDTCDRRTGRDIAGE